LTTVITRSRTDGDKNERITVFRTREKIIIPIILSIKSNSSRHTTIMSWHTTTVVCHDISSLEYCIKIIERYCDVFDIQINAKKTKCMVFGPIKSIVEPEIKVNGQILEIVENFKFLGVHIERGGKHDKHISIRRTAFLSGLTEIENLGFSKSDVPVRMKSLLYTSLVRSKLMYGMECFKLNERVVKKEIISLESNAIKKACGLNKRSKSTILLYALNITPIKLYILKRKLFFVLQLILNEATNELITSGVHATLNDVLSLIGVRSRDVGLGRMRYQGVIRSLVTKKLEEIRTIEKSITESKIVVSIKYLLQNRNRENDDTLQYLLDPRRCGDG
jgi:hypothetical protein